MYRVSISLVRTDFKCLVLSRASLFQVFRWWRAAEKLVGRGPILPSLFSLEFLFALTAYDLSCSPLSKRLEQASLVSDGPPGEVLRGLSLSQWNNR